MSMPAEQLITTPTLAELLQGIAAAPDISIHGISSDSRTLARGDLFLACAGISSHGMDYIEQAAAAGVAAIVWDSATALQPARVPDVPMIAVSGLAQHLGEIADRFNGHPSEAVQVIGVTGTNGKTTVAWIIAQCFEALGQVCGYVGTLGAGVGEIDGGQCMTTPGTVDLHGYLADFRNAGAAYAAVEVSSHALDQDRIAAVRFDTVLFTNLSRDHLDYHGDMRSYGEAKARLFLKCNAKRRIINLDSEFGAQLADRCGQDVVTVSTHFDRVANGRPYVFVRSVVAKESGSQIKVSSSWGDCEFGLPLPGDFNVANAIIVLALLLLHGVPLDQACDVLAAVDAPPGRMQKVEAADGLPSVYVDYAHTPEAMEVALRALRVHCKGELWCVFGCGGDRDSGKRPQMGKVAERLASRLVLTNDNSRSEAPAEIIAGIIKGLTKAEQAIIIEDRAAAIAWAIGEAGPEDVILIAGKGHENYQLIDGAKINFSDYGAALANLASLQAVSK